MRAIAKGAEPASLTRHRLTAHSDYDNYQDKDALRHALVAEQHGLCCYCMGRIRDDRDAMKVEHWHSQRNHGAEQLVYRNLLGACPGGMDRPPHLQHCDTRKGDRDLGWNPADPAHHIETRIRYEMDGSIRSDDSAFDAELREVLNLNSERLKNNRKAVLDSILDWRKKEKRNLQGPVPREQFRRERDFRIRANGEFTPYCQVAVWWLEQRLAGMAR